MKTSIKMLITVFIVLTSGLSLLAQNTATNNGIYLTANDYKTGKLTYRIGNNDKMQLNNFLDGKNVNLLYQDKKIKLSKSEIFGYRLNNQDFRFYHNEAYRLLDTAGFILYIGQKLTQKGKGYAPIERYFYSINYNQPVLDLTIANLWNSFPGSADFRYSLQSYFHNEDDLASFDSAVNQYKLKYLYFQHKTALAAQSKK